MWEFLVKGSRNQGLKRESSDIHQAHGPTRTGKEARVDRETEKRQASMSDGKPPKRGVRRLSCPVCHTKMDLVYVHDVEIDRCPDCLGVFLDKGELEAVSGHDFSQYVKGRHDKRVLVYTPHGLTNHVR